jgi:hypothetical protein
LNRLLVFPVRLPAATPHLSASRRCADGGPRRRRQGCERPFEAGAAGGLNRQECPVEAQARGFGQPARAVAHAIDRTDDRIASLDHLGKPVHAVLDATVMVQKLGRMSCRNGMQMGDDPIAPADVENARAGEVRRSRRADTGGLSFRRGRLERDDALSRSAFPFQPLQPGFRLSRPRAGDHQCTLALGKFLA